MENGESFEEVAKKEVSEETGLQIEHPVVLAITNNLRTFNESQKHYVSVIMFVNKYHGQINLMEPDKCERLVLVRSTANATPSIRWQIWNRLFPKK